LNIRLRVEKEDWSCLFTSGAGTEANGAQIFVCSLKLNYYYYLALCLSQFYGEIWRKNGREGIKGKADEEMYICTNTQTDGGRKEASK
jgi:hypothetical protein